MKGSIFCAIAYVIFLLCVIVHQDFRIQELQNTVNALYNIPVDCSAVCEEEFEKMSC